MKQEIKWSKMTEEQLKIVTHYCDNNMRELKKICNPILIKCNIPYMNYDELYDVAVDTLGKSIETYSNEKSQFKTFLTGNLKRKFIQWVRDNTRGCRCNVLKDENGNIVKDEKDNNIPIQNISIHQQINDEDNMTYGDVIASNFNIFDELSEEFGFAKDDKVEKYIQSLSIKQKKIGKLLSSGYTKLEIREILHMTSKEFSDQLNGMKSYRKISILF